MRFAIAVGRFYEDLAERLVEGATRVFEEAGAEVDVHDVPGAFELPLAARYCADSGRYEGVACLGAVIRGETDHYDYVCGEAAAGHRARAARHGRAVLVRRADGREHGAGARARRAAASATRARTRRAPSCGWLSCAVRCAR